MRIVARERGTGQVQIYIARDEQIQPPILVIIHEGTPGAPIARPGLQTRFLSCIRKSSVAIVAVKLVSTAVIADKEIAISVVIVIADTDPLTPT